MSAQASIGRTATTITPSDTASNAYAYISANVAGTIRLLAEGSTATVDVVVPAGGYVWVRTARVYSTGTTATGVVGYGD